MKISIRCEREIGHLGVGGRDHPDHPEETWVVGTYVDHVYINLGYPNFDTQALKDSDLDLHQC